MRAVTTTNWRGHKAGAELDVDPGDPEAAALLDARRLVPADPAPTEPDTEEAHTDDDDERDADRDDSPAGWPSV